MSSMNKEPLESVLGNYDIKVLSIKNECYKEKKGVWWIQTSKGYKILKKVSCSEDTLKYILSAIEHLTKNGINIPKVNKTSDGRSYVCINGTCYVLSDAVKGRNPEYTSRDDLIKIVKGLAKFHRASAGFSPFPGTKPKNHLGLWIEEYQQQVEDMKKFYENQLSLKGNDAFGKIIIKEFPHFYSQALKAVEGLKGEEYHDWVDKAGKAGSLCHQDFASGNLLLTSSGELFVLDTDSITMDIPSRDIRKLLNKIMKKGSGWNAELTKKIFDYYQTENPLTRSEWEVVKLDLMFPHLFLGAMNKYYYKRDKEWSESDYLDKIKTMSSVEKSITSIIDNFNSLIPIDIPSYRRGKL